ncbi:hypothetical protein JTB14_027110 [Gonioctena quinquepunctata]|nr:hypothetical protein JTB14_027110 [Gonioctena quinquepunctata]
MDITITSGNCSGKNLKSSSTNDAIYSILLDPSRFREVLIHQLLVAPHELAPLEYLISNLYAFLSEELDEIFYREICNFSRHYEGYNFDSCCRTLEILCIRGTGAEEKPKQCIFLYAPLSLQHHKSFLRRSIALVPPQIAAKNADAKRLGYDVPRSCKNCLGETCFNAADIVEENNEEYDDNLVDLEHADEETVESEYTVKLGYLQVIRGIFGDGSDDDVGDHDAETVRDADE